MGMLDVKLETEIARMTHEIDKLKLEQHKLRREIFWQPVGIATALIAAVTAVILAGQKLLGII